jgi:3-dehydroquinate dehydratase/shikimate dehydrogenase
MSVGPDRVCAVVARTRHKMMQVELREAAKKAKFVEVRLDFLAKAVDFKRLQPYKQCDWMATLRRPADGGRWPGTEAERQMVLRQAVVAGCFEWIDLETDIADGVKRFGTVKRVISYHNMIETPPDLDDMYDRMLKQDGDVYKIAVMPRTAADLGRVIAIQKRAPKPTVAFAMSDFGFPTRFTALKFGAPWIYALFNKDRELAPGMPALSDFRTTYPVKAIGPATRFYALLGDPVGHSFSPVLHNHLFLRNKVDAVYVPFRVPEGQLADAVAVMKAVPVSGYSVTIPHKEGAVPLAVDADPMVPQVGAANTLVAQSDGSFYAANTDFPAVIESLRAHLAERAEAEATAPREFGQMNALVLGAGGAARAAAFVLHRAGMPVTIAARTADRAKRLADDVGCKYTDWAARHTVTPCDVVVNCTPVGMHPNVDESPLHVSFLRPDLTVFDTVYNPEQTLLVRDARSRGCGVITGVEMFVRQAAMQFELFAQITPAVDELRELMRKAMSPLTKAMDEEARKSGLADDDGAVPDDDSEDAD